MWQSNRDTKVPAPLTQASLRVYVRLSPTASRPTHSSTRPKMMQLRVLLAALALVPTLSSASVIAERQGKVTCPIPGNYGCITRNSYETWTGICKSDNTMEFVENCSAKRYSNGNGGCCTQDPSSPKRTICVECP